MARLHARAWQRAYGEFLDHEALDYVSKERLLELWSEQLLSKPARRVWVFDQGGAIAGHVSVDEGELRMLYVDPVAQGAGVGGALLDVATAAGARTLRTFAANEPARAFYESRGWVFDGELEPWMGEAIVGYRRSAP